MEANNYKLVNFGTKRKRMVLEGFVFNLEKSRNGNQYYRCSAYRRGCRARFTITCTGTQRSSEHNHLSFPEQIRKCETRQLAKQLAAEQPTASSNQILSQLENTVECDENEVCILGDMDNLKRRIRQYKQNEHGYSSLGTSREDIVIPDTLSKTISLQKFVMYDSVTSESNRIIILASDKALEILSSCKTWQIDGTFLTCPREFYLYTIRGIFNDVSIPLVRGYLPGKTESIYVEFLNQVRRGIHFCPETILSDFELAPINAVRTVFPLADVKGCLFHFCQNIYRRIHSIKDVRDKYNNPMMDNSSTRDCLRCLIALPFLKHEDIESIFMELRLMFDEADPVCQIFDYFQNTCIGTTWNDCRFPMSFWNCHNRFTSGVPRSNNAMEGWHNSMNVAAGCHKPDMRKSISLHRKDEHHVELKQQQIRSGFRPRSYIKSAALNARLVNIITQYVTAVDKVKYLKSISHCILNTVVFSGSVLPSESEFDD